MEAAGWAGLAGLVTAALGGIAAIVAAVARRRTDRETAEEAAARAVREERAAIVTEYRGLLEEMRTASAEQERRWEARFGRLESDAKLALEHQQACERQLEDERTERVALAVRLRLAEAKIAELGG